MYHTRRFHILMQLPRLCKMESSVVLALLLRSMVRFLPIHLQNSVFTMTLSNQSQHFDYDLLDSGIHELNLYTASPEAYTQCFACLDRIFAQNSPDKPLLLLTNLHQFEVQRAADVLRLSRKLLVKYPQKRRLYNAVAYRSPGTISALVTAMSQIASVFGARVYFCRVEEQEKAVNWLLER